MTTRKLTHLVVAHYATARYTRNEIISRHTSYELARKAARKIGDDFTAVRRLDEVRVQGSFVAL